MKHKQFFRAFLGISLSLSIFFSDFSFTYAANADAGITEDPQTDSTSETDETQKTKEENSETVSDTSDSSDTTPEIPENILTDDPVTDPDTSTTEDVTEEVPDQWTDNTIPETEPSEDNGMTPPEAPSNTTEEPEDVETPDVNQESDLKLKEIEMTSTEVGADNTAANYYEQMVPYNGQVVDGYYIVTISAESIMNAAAPNKTYNAIQPALNDAEKKPKEVPYKIIIEPGTYDLDKALHLFSNTYFYAEGVTFRLTSDAATDLMKIGHSTKSEDSTGYFYQNITMYGGIWDSNFNSNTSIKVAHAKNFTMENLTVMNTKNAHLMEVAGVDGFKALNCTFQNQILDENRSKLTYEAIQLDILVQSHFAGYRSEDLPLKNVVINGCTFSNVPRGIGSHTATLNNPVNGIQITNNTFSNITSAAIQGMNYINCTISGNTITNASRGIQLYSVLRGDTFLPSTLEKEGGVKTTTPSTYVTPQTNQNINILNNVITLAGTDPYNTTYENTGIFLAGLNLSEASGKGDSDVLPKGNYFISGVAISGNRISTNGHGIQLQDVMNSTISGNSINYTGGYSSYPYYGIQLKDISTYHNILQNTITNCNSNGIYLVDRSTALSVSQNTISSVGFHGLKIENSDAGTVAWNNISNTGGDNIYASYGTVENLTQNTLSTSAQSGINIDTSAKMNSISNNTVSSSGTYGFYLHGSSSTASVTGNTVQSPSKYGLYVDNATLTSMRSNSILSPGSIAVYVKNNGYVKTLTSNTITSGKSRGISINSTKGAMTIAKNTVKNCKSIPLYLNTGTYSYTVTARDNKLVGKSTANGLHAASGKVSIYGNTIKSSKYAIQLTKKVKGTVKTNTCKNNQYNLIRVAGKNYSNLKKTSVSIRKAGANSIGLSWKSISGAKGYLIYRSTTKNGTYKKVTKKASCSYTNTGLAGGSKYYYKVVPFQKVNKSQVTIHGKESAIVKKKL